MTPGSLDNPLTDEEIEALEEFLMSESVPEGTMGVSMLDGLLTGIIVGPDLVPPSKWLPLVWGDEEGPVFETEEEATRIFALFMRHMNDIARTFAEVPEEFEPLFYEREVEGKTYTIPGGTSCECRWLGGWMKASGYLPGPNPIKHAGPLAIWGSAPGGSEPMQSIPETIWRLCLAACAAILAAAALSATQGCGDYCGHLCHGDRPIPRNGQCFCERPNGEVYGPVE